MTNYRDSVLFKEETYTVEKAMAVQVWIGEKPENPNERKAIIALAKGLDRLEGLYLMIANFSVGGHTIDIVVIKHDAIFLIEMKHCDGKVFGSVNGRWKVAGPTGSVKWLNQGRKNPYNQVISYYYALRNFLHNNRLEFLSEQKASMVNFRSCKRVIVISPTLEEGSEVKLDWRVAIKGLDELPTYLVTERTDEIVLSDNEIQAIPRLLNCELWTEVNQLVAGVMPNWETTPSEPPPPPEVVPVEAPVSPIAAPATGQEEWREHLRRSSQRTTLLVMGWATLLVLLGVLWLQRQDREQPLAVIDTTSTALVATPPVFPASPLPLDCVGSSSQTVIKQRDETYIWRSVTGQVIEPPFVSVSLEQVKLCPGTIIIDWSVLNRTDGIIQMGLANRNFVIRDNSGTTYQIREDQPPLRVRQDHTATASIVIDRGISPNATSMTIEIVSEPFNRQIYTIQLPTP